MKLDHVVKTPKRTLWIILFIASVVTLTFTAFLYNLSWKTPLEAAPWKVVVGIFCFFAVLVVSILLFWRLLKEMRVTQTQGDWIDRLSHEFRTPLASLALISGLLEQEGLSPDRKRGLWEDHRSELYRLTNEIELLLHAVRLRSQSLRVNPEWISLRAWIEGRAHKWKSILGSEASLEIEGNLSRPIYADPSLLDLILGNLLENSRKFSIQKPKVKIFIQQTQRKAFRWLGVKPKFELVVQDAGLGFRRNQNRAVFKRFYRTHPHIPGTGLGLYLCASAAKAQGFSLRGDSLGPNLGARFTLSGKL